MVGSMAEEWDVEALLEAPYRKEEELNNGRYNGGHSSADKENRRSSSSKKKRRSRSGSRTRDKRSRSRDRRSRSRDRRRSRSRGRRSRSRDRRRRSSRSRSRGRDRRRSRSRSRDRRRFSRDRRSRSRSRRDHRRRRTRSRSPFGHRSPPTRGSPLRVNGQLYDSVHNRLPNEDVSPEDRDLRTIFVMRLSQRVRARDLEEFFTSVGPGDVALEQLQFPNL